MKTEKFDKRSLSSDENKEKSLREARKRESRNTKRKGRNYKQDCANQPKKYCTLAEKMAC